jgi:drug/metabolite transporter (DMT)-like permease
MNKKTITSDCLLLLTAIIWGFAFTAQKTGMEFIGPFTYNGIRFVIGSLSLLPLILVSDRQKRKKNYQYKRTSLKEYIKCSLPIAIFLFIAGNIQQIGMIFTTAGNSGFITGFYIVLIPIVGVFVGKKTGIPTWIGAVVTVGGLFFVSGGSDLGKLNFGDTLCAIGAFFWTGHMLSIDKMVAKVDDPLKLSLGQFVITGALTLVTAVISSLSGLGAFLEPFAGPEIFSANFHIEYLFGGAVIPILYGGIGSVGIAYTLQIIAQKSAHPAHAAIILSFESVFAALGGILLLGERLGRWTFLGFTLMLAGMLATQWDVIRGEKRQF